ncbi:Rad52/Rad22 family DNA repair protein [Aestuariivirga sp.]|uniref:Rad52/Rad22 family DNA repair protein n=1 Tax=Aestuariivirga sp. TaxID=2650926 RepID=UPI003BAD7C9E
MSFTQSQVRKLRSKLRPQHIKTREAEGITLSYVEGWHVVAEANRIFGFEGWDRETISSECVWTKQIAGRYCAAYVVRTRIRVRAGEAVIVREGSGAGESNAATPGQAHEYASKAAETDATKRALMTFGNAFGLSLYSGVALARTEARKNEPTSEAAPGPASGIPFASPTLPIPNAPQPQTSGPEPVTQETTGAPDEQGRVSDQPSERPVSTGPAQELAPWQPFQPLEEAARMSEVRLQRIDKSDLTISEPRRVRDLGHLAFVASKPCLVCGRNRAHAHHLKFAQPTALGRKVSDEFTVPLCSTHHRELHRHGDERVWWTAQGIDAFQVAEDLWHSRRSATIAPRVPPRENSETDAL